MNKQDFIKAIVERTGAKKKEAINFINSYHSIVTEKLAKGENVSFIGFGAYSAEQSAERPGQNPATGEKITIPARVRAKFKAGKALKEALNTKKAKPAKKAKQKK